VCPHGDAASPELVSGVEMLANTAVILPVLPTVRRLSVFRDDADVPEMGRATDRHVAFEVFGRDR
jgi:hypothetical protein